MPAILSPGIQERTDTTGRACRYYSGEAERRVSPLLRYCEQSRGTFPGPSSEEEQFPSPVRFPTCAAQAGPELTAGFEKYNEIREFLKRQLLIKSRRHY